jgi:hypothetical protein
MPVGRSRPDPDCRALQELCKLTMRPEDLLINAPERFSLGIDHDSGKYYLSIPVANQLVDYEEYYEISQAEYENLRSNILVAIQFAADCRAHRWDNRLIVKPGKDRGT